MDSVTKLKQQQAELYDEAERLTELALDEKTKPELVDDLEKQADEKLAEGKALDAKIKRAEEIAALVNGGKEPRGGQIPLDDQPKKRKLEVPAQAKSWLPVDAFQPQEIHGMTAEERAYGFGRFALAIASREGRYRHLSKYRQGHIDTFGPMNAATEGGNAGIWVPDQFGTDIIILMKRYGLVRQMFQVVTMNSEKITEPKEGSDPTPTFVGEGVEGTDITPTDDAQVTLTARKLMGILIESSEVREDAIVEFGNSLMRRLANGFANKEDDCGLGAGDGTSTYGNMVSIRTKLQDVDGAGTDSSGLVVGAAGTGAAWSGFTLANFEKVASLLPDFADDGPEDAPSTAWICHRAFYWEVMRNLIHAQGGSPGEEIVNGFPRPVFLGYPVRYSNVFPSTAAVNSVVATLGNHARAAMFGDRRAYSVDFSTQATVGSVNLWSSDQVGFKATERFDINVHSVGDATNPGPVTGLATAAS